MSMEHNKTTPKSSLREFSLKVPEYNQDTYMGRFMTLMKTQNPFNTFNGNEIITKSRELLNNQLKLEKLAEKEGKPMLVELSKIKELRNAQYIVDSSVHPDTNQVIRPYQRFCSYSIFNIPILFGMILSKQTTTNIIFFQWVNQSYNAVLNFANGSASSETNYRGLGIAYSGAVTASIGIGLGMRRLLTPYASRFKGPAQLFMNFLINVTAIGAAGVLNVLIMRSNEMKEGITLTDKQGNSVGKSPKMGKDAVVKTAISRIVLPVPPLLLPTIAFYLMEKRNLVPKNRIAKTFLETGIFFCSMVFAPPLCCALFKQNCAVDVTRLEPEFHNLKDASGNSITELYYNKGL